MYRITLNYESINLVPAIPEELMKIFKATNIQIPKIEVGSHDKISFNCDELPTDEDAIRIGESYRNSFNQLSKEKGMEVEKRTLTFVGITELQKV